MVAIKKFFFSESKNIGLFVKETSEKEEVLLDYLSKTAGKIIIYCATRNKTEQISQLIQAKPVLRWPIIMGLGG